MKTTVWSPVIMGRLKSRSARISRPPSSASMAMPVSSSCVFSARRKEPATLSTEPMARSPQS